MRQQPTGISTDSSQAELTAQHQTDGTFGKLLLEMINKANESQHTLNVQTEMLKNKPNNC